MARLWLLTLLLWTAALAGHAQGVLAVPALSGHVVDTTGTLDATQRQALESKLATFEAAHGAQVVVLLVPTTQPEDIASFANRVGNTWKIGRKTVGDGLLLIVAKSDRKLRVEVAKSLEGAVPDLAAKGIMDSAITPAFKQGDYAAGLNAGVDQLMALIKGEGLPAPAQKTGAWQTDAGFQWQDLAVFVFFGVLVGGTLARRVLGNKLGSIATGGVVGWVVNLATGSLLIAGLAGLAALVFVLVSSVGRSLTGGHAGGFHSNSANDSWSSGSGSDGGGFSSGGGGDFGGGGASGDW